MKMSNEFNFYQIIPDLGLEERRKELEVDIDLLSRELIAAERIHQAIVAEQERRRDEREL